MMLMNIQGMGIIIPGMGISIRAMGIDIRAMMVRVMKFPISEQAVRVWL
jgi:hypothetical protein